MRKGGETMAIQNMECLKHLPDVISAVSKLLASEIAKELGPELKKLSASETASFATVKMPLLPSTPHGSLWSLADLASDSGIKKGTWYKWINQRKLPVV